MPAIVSTAARASTAPSKVATDRDHPSTALPAAVTGIDEAVSAATEQARIDARRRMQLALLPENAFSLLRDQRGKQRTTAAATKSTNGSTGGGFLSDDGVVPRNSHQRVVSAPTAAAVSADDNNKGVKIGVGEALDRWALQTSRRESMVLWRHESSRYASPSRIGYHPNHPSASRPSSRPSSAATVRPFSAGLGHAIQQQQQQQQQQQRASSALPSRSLPPSADNVHAQKNTDTPRTMNGKMLTNLEETVNMPSSAHLGTVSPFTGEHGRHRVQIMEENHIIERVGGGNVGGGVPAATELLERPVSASERGKSGGGGGMSGGGGHDGRDATKRGGGGDESSRVSPTDNDEISLYQEEGESDDDIYEDLGDEDDGEVDNRISILENRFSAVGRERPTSAVMPDGGQSAILDRVDPERRATRQMRGASHSRRHLPRLPPQQAAAARITTRRLASAEGNGAPRRTSSAVNTSHHASSLARVESGGALRLVKSRPTSAPTNSSLLYQRGVSDPVAALDDRRKRLQRSRTGAGAGAGGGYRPAVDAGKKKRSVEDVNPRPPPARDATTAILYWNSNTAGDKGRPISCATEGAATTNENKSSYNSRPSSAAFRRWVEARPSVKSAVSAVSSARTLGMDDPELLHLQLEMESRRAPMSETMLARMEDHYKAVVLKSSSPRSQQQAAAGRAKRGRQLSPQTKRGGGGATIPGGVVASASSGSRKKRGASAKSKGRSRSKDKNKMGQGGVGGRGRSSSKGKGKAKGKAKGPTNAELMPRRVYPSALAFMAEHFPSQEKQGVSLLWMEQEEECRHASEALSRIIAGVACGNSATVL